MDLSRRRMLFGLGAATLAGGGVIALTGDLLKGGSAAAATPAMPDLRGIELASYTPPPTSYTPVSYGPVSEIKRVALHNLHTGDKLDAVFYEKGAYVPDALDEAMRVLRDWRNGEEHAMDPRLFDVMHALSEKLETKAPFQIISGYRSPSSNAAMHERSAGVASHSQHMLGKASDIRVDGVQLTNLHRAARSLGAGGVGFYPVSNFVHVDVGAVRTWTGV